MIPLFGTRTRQLRTALGVGVLCAAMTACGGGTAPSSGTSGPAPAEPSPAAAAAATSEAAGGGELIKVTVGILPITSVAAVKLGAEKGFFKEEGLEITTEVAQSGAALVPAIASGQYDFGFSNNLSLALANGKGLPIRIVRTANSAGVDPNPTQESLVTGKNSGVNDVKDLVGKTIAVSSLNNTTHLSALVTLENHGVDPKSVKFVELAIPDMPVALEQGRVQAADIWEPFVTKALEMGGKDLAHPSREIEPDLHISSWFTTQTYIDKNPEIVAKFARAVDKSNAYANEHQDELKAFIPTFLKIDAEVAKKINLDHYPEGATTLKSLQHLIDAAVRHNIIPAAPANLDKLVADIG